MLLEKVLETENLRFFDVTIEEQIDLLKEKVHIKFNPLFLPKEINDRYFIKEDNVSYGSLEVELSSKIYLEALKENKKWVESSGFKNTGESFDFFQQKIPKMIFEPIQTLTLKEESENSSTNENQELQENQSLRRSQTVRLILPERAENSYENSFITIPEAVTTSLNFVDYHGNYQNAKKLKEVINYCTKDLFINNPLNYKDDFIVMGTLEKSLGDYGNYLSLSERMIAIAEKGNIDFALEMLKKENPELFTTKSLSIRRNLEDMYLRKIGKLKTYPLESFIVPQDMKYFMHVFEMSIEAEDAKVLVLIGDPGTGRTQFAKAYTEQKLCKNPLVINHREGLSQFIKGYHESIIFDDPDFSDETLQTLIRLMDNQEAPIKIRYTNAIIPVNTPKVITSNIPLTEINKGFNEKSLQRRMINCDIGSHKLFDIDKTLKLATDPDQIKMLSLKKQFALEFRKAKRLERMIEEQKSLYFDQKDNE